MTSNRSGRGAALLETSVASVGHVGRQADMRGLAAWSLVELPGNEG